MGQKARQNRKTSR